MCRGAGGDNSQQETEADIGGCAEDEARGGPGRIFCHAGGDKEEEEWEQRDQRKHVPKVRSSYCKMVCGLIETTSDSYLVQLFNSIFFSFYVCKAGLWIRIHFLGIRIQQFFSECGSGSNCFLNADPDPSLKTL